MVTGSTGRGMGRSIAWTLAREGADVALNYGTYHKSSDQAKRVAEVVEGFGVRSTIVQADTSDAEAVQALVRRTVEVLGKVDILVNNAGGPWDSVSFTSIKPEHWRRVIGAEINGALYATRALLPAMKRRRWGRIVNLGMERSEEWTGPPYDYTLGKAARHILTRNLAHGLSQWNVTINTVAPGYTPPYAWRDAVDAVHHRGKWLSRSQPTAQDAAEVVAFLASEEARFVNGATITIRPNYSAMKQPSLK